jgi:hypothetical protein
MKIDGYKPIDSKIALKEGTTFSYETPYGNITIIARIASDENTGLSSAFLKSTEENAKKKRLGTYSLEAYYKDMLAIYAEHVVIKWTTTIKSEGKVIQPTRENFVDLFSSQVKEIRAAFTMFQEDCSNAENFRAQFEEELTKN